jgi:hypothetical protein
MIIGMIDFANFMNVSIFTALTVSGGLIFYYSIKNSPERISMGVFVLIIGFFLIGLSHLFRIGIDVTSVPIVITNFLGVFFILAGVSVVFLQGSRHMEGLRKRQEEIKSIITVLKDKYYQQEVSEEELKPIYAQLLKELAEIEVRLKEKN